MMNNNLKDQMNKLIINVQFKILFYFIVNLYNFKRQRLIDIKVRSLHCNEERREMIPM